MTHKCAYEGSQIHGIPACQNITDGKIFCQWCFQSVTPAARQAWKIAFPYDVPYDLAMTKESHKDQKLAILRMRENITFAKRQLSIFGEEGKIE